MNTIRLLKGYARLTKTEMKRFNKGDTIWGEDSNPEEIKRWGIEQKEEAYAELEKYICRYKVCQNDTIIEEYALEFYHANSEGEFVWGG